MQGLQEWQEWQEWQVAKGPVAGLVQAAGLGFGVGVERW